jgi:hypothetical protein
MSRDDEVRMIAFVFKSRDMMLLERHSECNHLLRVVGQKPVQESKPYVATIGMLGYFLPNILAPRKLCVGISNKRPSFRLFSGGRAPMVDGNMQKV